MFVSSVKFCLAFCVTSKCVQIFYFILDNLYWCNFSFLYCTNLTKASTKNVLIMLSAASPPVLQRAAQSVWGLVPARSVRPLGAGGVPAVGHIRTWGLWSPSLVADLLPSPHQQVASQSCPAGECQNRLFVSFPFKVPVITVFFHQSPTLAPAASADWMNCCEIWCRRVCYSWVMSCCSFGRVMLHCRSLIVKKSSVLKSWHLFCATRCGQNLI